MGDADEAFEVRVPLALPGVVERIFTFDAAGELVDYVAAEELCD